MRICAGIFFFLAGGYLSMFGYAMAWLQIIRYGHELDAFPYVFEWSESYFGFSIPVWRISYFYTTVSLEALGVGILFVLWLSKSVWDFSKAIRLTYARHH
jgi:hypothetical protein